MSYTSENILTTSSHTAAESFENDDFQIRQKLTHYLRNHEEHGSSVFRHQIQQVANSQNPFIEVDLDSLSNFDTALGNIFYTEADRCLTIFEEVATQFALDIFPNSPPVQVLVRTSSTPNSIRNLNSTHIGKLVTVPGLVISTSSISPRATEITAMCTQCKSSLQINCKTSGYILPRQCERQSEKSGGPPSSGGKCPLDPYIVIPELSKFSDSQYLKIQESPEDVPPGEMPRHISAAVDRALANAAIPGSRNLFVSIYSLISGPGKFQKPFLRIIGLISKQNAQEIDIEDTLKFFKTREDIFDVIAPEIFGMEDVKIGIAAQLFGGVRKTLPDSTKLRGDLNVLLFGDPSVAKSQLLKFSQKVAPIGIYTSGKGSSAAGLTASVIKNKNYGEFVLEGGAMVLADGGLVCIDEFDKMKSEDRVAIHEAMEQQTISISKAGINAVLNTRAAVLAAANPHFGRFDDLKTARDNIDFQTTILSRFDLIYILKDIKDETKDKSIATHVLDIHQKHNEKEPSEKFQSLKKFIQYAKMKCHPVIGDSAMKLLNSEYVKMRTQVNSSDSIPITVRQLEALIRLTESFARMELCDECKESHVIDAIRLFKSSTLEAAKTGIIASEGHINEDQQREIEHIERYINRRCPIGTRIPERALIHELQHQNFSDFCITRCLQSLLCSQQFEYQHKKTILKRILINE